MTCRSTAQSSLRLVMGIYFEHGNRWALKSRAYLFLSRDNSDLPKIAEEHLPIVKALESGDGRKAGAMLRRHCLTFAKEVMTLESPSSSSERNEARERN